jgi:RHS repeat-associated protein
VLYDGINNYWYNAEGQLCAVYKQNGSVTMYSYDAEGRREAKGTLNALPSGGAAYGNVATNGSCGPVPPVTSSTTGFTLGSQYLLDLGGNQATELTGTTPQTQAWLHSNVWTGGKLLATYDTLGVHFPLTDPLGTKRIQANYLGITDLTCASLPFGDAQYCTGDDATEHHFTQKERDTESGNDYFGARYYSSAFGRFMSPDEAFADQHPGDPQTWNLYMYTRNNPINNIDLNGRGTVGQIAWGIVVGVGKFLWNTSVPGMAISGMAQSIHELKIGPVAARAEARARLRAIGTVVAAAQGDPWAQELIANAAVNAWKGMNTTDKASTVTQGVLMLGTMALGGYAAGAGSAGAVGTEAAGASPFVFYSGPGAFEAATEWSAANNGTMIGMTEFGQAIDAGTMTAADGSEAFANSASGTMHVFSNDPFTNYEKIWYNNELPVLANNPNVTNLVIHPVPTK